jgi:hypothetical protein
MWGGVEFRSSLFEGVKDLKVVHPILVKKVRVCIVVMSFMGAGGEKPLSLDLKGSGVRCSGTF